MLTNVTVKILVSKTIKLNLLILFSGPLFRSGIMLDPQKENILLLGMVFSDQLVPTRGQEFRECLYSIPSAAEVS